MSGTDSGRAAGASQRMRAIVLGSAIASGIPSWNDGSEAALRARAHDATLPRRRGALLAVSADGLRHSLIEAPFHLADTLARDTRFAPAPGRNSVPLDSIVMTSGSLDACAGSLALRAGLAARLASPAALRADLLENDAAFETLEPLWLGLGWDRPLVLDRNGHLEARLFPLPGPMPDHLRERASGTGRARCGVRITDQRTGKRLVWAPRIEHYDSATLAELREADIRLVDGTFYAADEGRRLQPGVRSSIDLGHAPIDGPQGSLAWLSGMAGESIYVHMATTNPIIDRESKEARRVREAGVEIAHDGLEIDL